MTIETKFDIGDEAWGIHYRPFAHPASWDLAGSHNGWPLLVDDITLQGQDVAYHLGGAHRYWWPEPDLFPTPAAARAECDRRNAEAAKS